MKREKLATLEILDCPGISAMCQALFFTDTTVSFRVEAEADKLSRLSAAVMSVDLNDKPDMRQKFLIMGIILRSKWNGEWAGCHYLAYLNVKTRRGTLVILGEPIAAEKEAEEPIKNILPFPNIKPPMMSIPEKDWDEQQVDDARLLDRIKYADYDPLAGIDGDCQTY